MYSQRKLCTKRLPCTAKGKDNQVSNLILVVMVEGKGMRYFTEKKTKSVQRIIQGVSVQRTWDMPANILTLLTNLTTRCVQCMGIQK